MARIKRPSVSRSFINDSVAKITGYDIVTVRTILETYGELMYKTVSSGVEFPLYRVGVLGFAEKAPKPAGMYHNPYFKQPIEYPARCGYLALSFRVSGRLRDRLKANTVFGEGMKGDEYRQWLSSIYEGEWGKPLHQWGNRKESTAKKDEFEEHELVLNGEEN